MIERGYTSHPTDVFGKYSTWVGINKNRLPQGGPTTPQERVKVGR